MQHGQDPSLAPQFSTGAQPQSTPARLLVVDASSSRVDARAAADELCDRVIAALASSGFTGPADLVFLFLTPDYASALPVIEQTIATRLAPGHIVAATTSAVLAGEFEFEGAQGLSMLACVLPGVRVTPFCSADLPADLARTEIDETPTTEADLAAVAAATGIGPGHRATVLIADPFTTPIDGLLSALGSARALANPHGAGSSAGDGDHRRAPIVGGFASAAPTNRPGGNTLMIDGKILTTGCVGVSLSGALRADCVLSQGCRPIGPNLVVTSSQGQFIRSLGGRPALQVLEEIVESLDGPGRAALGGGVMIGRVVNEYKDHFGRDDYLMRAVVGVMKEDRAIAIADRVRTGQTVRFHVRDALTAHEDLAMLMDAQTLHEPPAGALVFTCNGRGMPLFQVPHHDAQAIQNAFRQDQPAEMKAKAGTPINLRPTIPLAGMFAAGEFGPVGDRTYLHGQSLCALLLRRP